MSELRSRSGSPYMEFAKLRARARFDLAASDVSKVTLSELEVSLQDIELSAPGGYGYGPLRERLASRCQVPAACVVTAEGTSMANHLAMAALLEPGDEILVERPTYEPLLSTARFLGARVRRFERRLSDGFRVDPGEVTRELTSRTRLVVITNLHNPSGVLAEEATLRSVGDAAERVGARVLVDEVYLDTAFAIHPRSAFHLGPVFVTTNSLTKTYGLSGLRCGWVLAEPEIARRMWRLNDLFGATGPHPAERLSVVALDQIAKLSERARERLERNRVLRDRFLESRPELRAVRPEFGTICFPELSRGSVEALLDLLHERYETSVAPGVFFEMPRHFRIGIGGETAIVEEGLERLGAAIEIASRF